MELEEIVRVNEAKYKTHDGGKSSARRIVHKDRMEELIRETAGFELAAVSGQHILDPSTVSPVGKRDQKSIGRSKNIHGRTVDRA